LLFIKNGNCVAIYRGSFADVNIFSILHNKAYLKDVIFSVFSVYTYLVFCVELNSIWKFLLDIIYINQYRTARLVLRKIISNKQLVPELVLLYLSSLSLWSSDQSSWLITQRSRVRFPAPPDFLSSSGSGTGSTQPL
jgi:hypothetical protein